MVMVTRSSRRKACDVFADNSSSDVYTVPPWCSSAKLEERKKPWEIQSSICEMRSPLPSQKNVWKIPHKNRSATNSSCSCRRKIKSSRQKTTEKVGICKALVFVLLTLSVALGAFLIQQKLAKMSLKSTNELLSLVGINKRLTALDDECCYKMKYLSVALLKAEQTLRRMRRQHTLQLTAQSAKLDRTKSEINADFIAGSTAVKGVGTEEWSGRAALWGIVPLWKTSPSPRVLLTLRKPTPADCWPFSGSRGEVIIEFPHPLRVRTISVEHVRPDAARSAPRHFVLYAIAQNGTWIKSLTDEYTYDGPSKQFYSLQRELPPVKRVAFRVLSNHGNTRYTCVYRVHVYEKERNV